jgi:hypothetical protein
MTDHHDHDHSELSEIELRVRALECPRRLRWS